MKHFKSSTLTVTIFSLFLLSSCKNSSEESLVEGATIQDPDNTIDDGDSSPPVVVDPPPENESYEQCHVHEALYISQEHWTDAQKIYPFKGSISATENYNYFSYSAHPLHGPAPVEYESQFYLYENEEGLHFSFHHNKDNSTKGWTHVRNSLVVSNNDLLDDVIIADEKKEFHKISGTDDNPQFAIHKRLEKHKHKRDKKLKKLEKIAQKHEARTTSIQNRINHLQNKIDNSENDEKIQKWQANINKKKDRLDLITSKYNSKKQKLESELAQINATIENLSQSYSIYYPQENESSYLGLFNYTGNTDGAMIGPLLGKEFALEMKQSVNESINSAKFFSESGENIVLDFDEDKNVDFTLFHQSENICREVLMGCYPNLISNGSFEEDSPLSSNSGWNVFHEILSWKTSDFHEKNAGFEVQKGAIGGLSAQDGIHKIELDAHPKNGFTESNGSISQKIDTEEGKHYELSFHYAPRRQNVADSNAFGVFVNGALLKYYRNDGASGWQEESLNFKAQSHESVIEFRALGKEDTYGAYIDNISAHLEGHEESLCDQPQPD